MERFSFLRKKSSESREKFSDLTKENQSYFGALIKKQFEHTNIKLYCLIKLRQNLLRNVFLAFAFSSVKPEYKEQSQNSGYWSDVPLSSLFRKQDTKIVVFVDRWSLAHV
jgi:hypothetical protein